MKPIFYKIKNLSSSQIARLLKEYRWYLIIFFGLFLLGYITGIFTAGRYSGDLSCENLINTYLYSLLTKDTKTITYFIIISVYFLVVSLFFIIFTRNKFMIVIDAILLLLIGYVAGFDICIIFICLGLSGIVLGFISYGVIGLLFFANLCLILSISSKMAMCKSNTEIRNKGFFKFCFVLILIGALYIFLISFIFSLIHLFVIVG